MASNPSLSARVRDALKRQRGIEEKRMFGCDAFLLHGNLLVAIWNNSLIARLGIDQASAGLQQPHVGPMDITGKPMRGWVIVESAAKARSQFRHVQPLPPSLRMP